MKTPTLKEIKIHARNMAFALEEEMSLKNIRIKIALKGIDNNPIYVV